MATLAADNPDGRARSPATGTGVTLGLRRVYIFPNRHGWTFIAALGVMLIGAVNYGNSLAFILTFLLSGLGLVGILHTFGNLAGLRYAGGRVEPVFAGGTALFKLSFDNRRQRARVSVLFESKPRGARERWWRTRRERAQLTFVDIPADGWTAVTVPLKASRRGVLELGRIRIESTYPLGMLRAWAYLDTELRCLVYPQPLGQAELPSGLSSQPHRGGGRLQGTDDFVGFRDYHAGDSPRYIAWKVFARTDELVVKRFTGGGAPALKLHWDQTLHLGNAEMRLSQLCRWVLAADALGVSYGLTLPGVDIARDVGDAHRHRCLKALALYGRS